MNCRNTPRKVLSCSRTERPPTSRNGRSWSELLREKLLLCLDKEIPHGTAVGDPKFSERDSGVVDVDATIYCEKASHKGIIIGKQGAMLKKISSLARADMEKFMGTRSISRPG